MSDLEKAFESARTGDLNNLPYIIVVERPCAENPEHSNDIRLHNVSIKAPGKNGDLLVENLNLVLRRGSKIVLTGASGTGKTVTGHAILGQHDNGSGLIAIPPGLNIMEMPQQAYFSNAPLRAILNKSPAHLCKFKDEDLTEALQSVGLDHLIEQIPGQQVKILADDLAKKIPGIAKAYSKNPFSLETATKIHADLYPTIQTLVKKQFKSVQCVPDAQKEYIKEQVSTEIKKSFGTIEDNAIDMLAKEITHSIDTALVEPLQDFISTAMPEIAANNRGRIFAYSPEKAKYFNYVLESKLAKRMKQYMLRKDTDDLSREIRLNDDQIAHLVKFSTQKMKEDFKAHTKQGILTQIFNAPTWPLSLQTLRSKAKSAADDIAQSIGVFMDQQVLRGDNMPLSGGQKQKLMIAMAILHKPDFLLADEITAALDKKSAESLYDLLLKKIPETTTVLSIAHNDHIVKYHTHHAHLADKTIKMYKIDEGYDMDVFRNKHGAKAPIIN